jgi:hypothetical protein
MAQKKGVKGLIIPFSRSVSQTMDCVDLFSDSGYISVARVGYDRAVVFDGQKPAMLQFSWPEEQSSSLISHKRPIQISYCPKIHFDSSSSRIVMCGRVFKTVVSIYDLAAV